MTSRYRRSFYHKPCRLEIEGRLLYDARSVLREMTEGTTGVEFAALFDSTRENSPNPDIVKNDRLIALS